MAMHSGFRRSTPKDSEFGMNISEHRALAHVQDSMHSTLKVPLVSERL